MYVVVCWVSFENLWGQVLFYLDFSLSLPLGFRGPGLALGGIRLINLDSVSQWTQFQIHLVYWMAVNSQHIMSLLFAAFIAICVCFLSYSIASCILLAFTTYIANMTSQINWDSCRFHWIWALIHIRKSNGLLHWTWNRFHCEFESGCGKLNIA